MISKFGLGVVSSKYEEYCRNAMVCESMSHSTSSESIKDSWLKLAESWLQMIPQDSSFDEAPYKSFDLAAQRTGTGQENSKSSH
jgi:hypothetical protein